MGRPGSCLELSLPPDFTLTPVPIGTKLLPPFPFPRKDVELTRLQARIEDEQGLVAQLQKKLKEFQVRQTRPELKSASKLVLTPPPPPPPADSC